MCQVSNARIAIKGDQTLLSGTELAKPTGDDNHEDILTNEENFNE